MTVSKATLSSAGSIRENIAFKESVFKNCRAVPLPLPVQCSPHKAHQCQRISKGDLPDFLTHEVSSDNVQSKLAQDFPTPFDL